MHVVSATDIDIRLAEAGELVQVIAAELAFAPICEAAV